MHRLTVLMACLLMACGNKKENTAAPAKHHDSLPAADTGTAEETGDLPRPVEIGRSSLHPGPLVINGPLVADSALHKIFPGHYADMPAMYGQFNAVYWTCKSCPATGLFYHYFIDAEQEGMFPDKNYNASLVQDDDTLELDGKTYRLITFFHTQQYELDFTGRFSGTPEGVALFRQEGNRYVLESFAGLLGTFGSFSTPISPAIYKAGKKHLLLDFSYTNGGPGSEATAVMEMFLNDGNTFRQVLMDRFLFCTNTNMGEWSSEIFMADTLAETGPCDMDIVTSGWVDGKSMDEETDEDDLHYFATASAELRSRAEAAKKSGEKFKFRLTRTFRYNGKAYTLAGSKTEFL